MANNWAIVIGINEYRFLQPLKYAKQDAEAMHGFLIQEAKFDRIFLFTDDSPAISGKPTEPFRANLLRVLRQIFSEPFMKDGDNFWFFFSGHGIPHNGQDYLMPLDGDPEDIENTGISTNTIANYLRSCGADNTVMILDACRNGGKKSGEGIGRQTEAEARQTGVISLFSCSPDQYSYELEAIGQGAFTYALLEGLGIQGRCSTVERLNQYLEHRVSELVSQQYLARVKQTPYTIAEPLNRSHLILMPQHASLADVATLKNDAYRAQMSQDWDLAQRLWIRVNAAASGQDVEAIEALQNLGIQRSAQNLGIQQSAPTNPVTLTVVNRKPQYVTSKSQPLSAPRSIQTPVLRSLTRQQFLKWAIPGGLGIAGVTFLRQFLGQSPRTSPSPVSDTPSNPQPITSQRPQSSSLPSSETPSSPQPSDSPIKPKQSETDIDYSRLEEFLKARQWEDADRETAYLLVKMANRDKKHVDSERAENVKSIDIEGIKNIPCDALSQIDRFWVTNSGGKFGFSTQMKIYKECGGKADGEYTQYAWDRFGDRVGWSSQSGMSFSINAPSGHLPAKGLTLGAFFPPGFDGAPISDSRALLLFTQKLLDCSIK